MSISGELIKFAGGGLLIEVPFGLMWASLSWFLQWGVSSLLNQFRAAGFLPREASTRPWANMDAVLALAFVEAIALGVPLAYINTGLVNFSMATDDAVVTITDRSIMIESVGILLAFPLACLAAGYFGGRGRKSHVTAAEA